MPTTSASSPVRLRKMMRRVRLEKLSQTKSCQARRASPLPPSGRAGSSECARLSSGRCASTPVTKLSGVLSSTVSLPGCVPPFRPGRHPSVDQPAPSDHEFDCCGRAASHLLEAVADAVERLDHIEVVVGRLEFLAQPLDVAVDGAVVD